MSFESWGQLNRTKDDGVCKANVVLPKQKIKRPKLIYDVASTSNGNSTKKKTKPEKPKKVDVSYLMNLVKLKFF